MDGMKLRISIKRVHILEGEQPAPVWLANGSLALGRLENTSLADAIDLYFNSVRWQRERQIYYKRVGNPAPAK